MHLCAVGRSVLNAKGTISKNKKVFSVNIENKLSLEKSADNF